MATDKADAVRGLIEKYNETKKLTEIDQMYDADLVHIAEQLVSALEEMER